MPKFELISLEEAKEATKKVDWLERKYGQEYDTDLGENIVTQTIENFTGTTILEATETMGIPLGILNRFLDDVKEFYDAGKFGGLVLMAPDTANIDSINATISDEVTFEVKSKGK